MGWCQWQQEVVTISAREELSQTIGLKFGDEDQRQSQIAGWGEAFLPRKMYGGFNPEGPSPIQDLSTPPGEEWSRRARVDLWHDKLPDHNIFHMLFFLFGGVAAGARVGFFDHFVDTCGVWGSDPGVFGVHFDWFRYLPQMFIFPSSQILRERVWLLCFGVGFRALLSYGAEWPTAPTWQKCCIWWGIGFLKVEK